MHSKLVLSALAALSLGASAQKSSTDCPQTGIHLVVGPGMGGGPNDYGYIGSLTKSIMKAIPGSNNFCIGGYNGTDGLSWAESGEQQFRDHMDAFTRDCPNIPMAIIGYSVGALSSMNAVCGASPSPPWPQTQASLHDHKLIALLTYGDETHSHKRPYNAGTCTKNAPKVPRTNVSGCKGFFKHMKSYCDKNDVDCCIGGESVDAHFAYPKKYDGQATNFIVKQYREYLKKKRSH